MPVDGTSVPVWDEDPDETFTGPEFLDRFFQEEYETAELFSGEADEDEYDDDGSYSQTLVHSAAQRSSTTDALHAETGSGQTQFVAVQIHIGKSYILPPCFIYYLFLSCTVMTKTTNTTIGDASQAGPSTIQAKAI